MSYEHSKTKTGDLVLYVNYGNRGFQFTPDGVVYKGSQSNTKPEFCLVVSVVKNKVSLLHSSTVTHLEAEVFQTLQKQVPIHKWGFLILTDHGNQDKKKSWMD